MHCLVRILLLCIALATAGQPADAADDLYQTKVIVTGKGEKNRKIGFRHCLDKVLVRVTGDPRLLAKPELAPLRDRAGTLVASFTYRDRLEGVPIHDEQGTYDRPHDLTCFYRPETLDPVLALLDSKPWLTERPKLVLFLAVQDQKREFVLSTDGDESPFMVESFEAAAEPMAISIAIPNSAVLERYGLIFEEVSVASPELLGGMTKAIGGEVPFLGSIGWSDADLGWTGHWRLYFQGRTYQWSVRGVSFDEAFRVAMRGAAQVLSGNGQP